MRSDVELSIPNDTAFSVRDTLSPSPLDVYSHADKSKGYYKDREFERV